MTTRHESKLYAKKALPISLVRKVLSIQQRRVFALYSQIFRPLAGQRILDLGVSPAYEKPEYFFFEYLYPFKSRIVAAGVEPPGRFEEWYPEVSYVELDREGPLPFEDGEFDVVFCSAVIEHVGSRRRQAEFLREVLRVGNGLFLTTPNRWFPVELHTVLPFVHYLPAKLYRPLLRRLGFAFFADEENLNLLDRTELTKLIPPESPARILGLRFLGLTANLVLVVAPEGTES